MRRAVARHPGVDNSLLLREMWSSVRGYWDGAEGYQRFLYVVAAA